MFEFLTKTLYETIKMGIPPSVANASMTFSRFTKKQHPINFNKKFIDKEPVFGTHKTYEGLAIGVGCGTGMGILLSPLFGLKYAAYSLGASSLTGAGDLIGSFIKRRLKIKEGANVPYIDRTIWIMLPPLLYKLMYDLPSEELVAIYGIALPIGYSLHHVFNKIKDRIYK